jgi:hypothetical protein
MDQLTTPDGQPTVTDAEIGFVYTIQPNDTTASLRALRLDMSACAGDFDTSISAIAIEPTTSVTTASVCD